MICVDIFKYTYIHNIAHFCRGSTGSLRTTKGFSSLATSVLLTNEYIYICVRAETIRTLEHLVMLANNAGACQARSW
jgi:hypothetical protein